LRSFYSPTPTPLVQTNSSTPSQPSLEGTVIEPETLGVEEREVPLEIEGSSANELIGLRGSNNVDQVIADLGLRMPIEQIGANIRDVVRRAYIVKGTCRAKGHNPWLEYSIGKDVAFCFYCYHFKQQRVENYCVNAFTVVGFHRWKDGCETIGANGNGIDHNKSRRAYEDYKNQRQSVSHVMNRGGKKMEEKYKVCLLVILGVVRFLLLQALAFRGHDESYTSSNKGNFLELLQLYKDKDKNVANLLRTNQMASPNIPNMQLDYVAKCYSSVFDFFQTGNLIVNSVNASCKRRGKLVQQHHEKLVNMLERGEIFFQVEGKIKKPT
jgi:hypothetical protein